MTSMGQLSCLPLDLAALDKYVGIRESPTVAASKKRTRPVQQSEKIEILVKRRLVETVERVWDGRTYIVCVDERV